MSDRTVTVTAYYRIECDRCGRSHETDVHEDTREFWEVRREMRRALAAAGWRRFVSRVARDYCPGCGPSKGHKMREVPL